MKTRTSYDRTVRLGPFLPSGCELHNLYEVGLSHCRSTISSCGRLLRVRPGRRDNLRGVALYCLRLGSCSGTVRYIGHVLHC